MSKVCDNGEKVINLEQVIQQLLKLSIMTRTITINKPSQKMIQVFDSLREKKHQQIEMLLKKKECIFTIKV